MAFYHAAVGFYINSWFTYLAVYLNVYALLLFAWAQATEIQADSVERVYNVQQVRGDTHTHTRARSSASDDTHAHACMPAEYITRLQACPKNPHMRACVYVCVCVTGAPAGHTSSHPVRRSTDA